MEVKQISVFDVLRGRESTSVGPQYSAIEVATTKANLFSKIPTSCFVPPPLRQMEDIANMKVNIQPASPPRLFIKTQEGFVERNFWIILILLAILLIVLICLIVKQLKEIKKMEEDETRRLSKIAFTA